MIVGILQTGHANIKSLSNTIERMGHEVSNVSTPQQMELVDKLILPGVGARTRDTRRLPHASG